MHTMLPSAASGCAGFTVGRALWGEAALAAPADRPAVIAELIAPRLAALRDLVDWPTDPSKDAKWAERLVQPARPDESPCFLERWHRGWNVLIYI